jgi:hypothetical protein
VEVVNGITAGLAGATQCDIPLTLRGVSRGVTLVTAHTQDDSELNWRRWPRAARWWCTWAWRGWSRFAVAAGGGWRRHAGGDDRECVIAAAARVPQ